MKPLLPLDQAGGIASRNRTDDLRITRVFPCVARGFKARASFMFAGCCWWRSLAIDGSSGTSRGHGSVMRRPGSRWDGAVQRPSAFQAGHIPVGADRASVVRCRWSLLSAGGCCCCCHRCCQPLVLVPFSEVSRRCDSALSCPDPSNSDQHLSDARTRPISWRWALFARRTLRLGCSIAACRCGGSRSRSCRRLSGS